jgi:hypothetical protein
MVSPYFPWVLHLKIQPTLDQKYLKKIVSVLDMYDLLFLSLFPKQYSIKTIYTEFTWYWAL